MYKRQARICVYASPGAPGYVRAQPGLLCKQVIPEGPFQRGVMEENQEGVCLLYTSRARPGAGVPTIGYALVWVGVGVRCATLRHSPAAQGGDAMHSQRQGQAAISC